MKFQVQAGILALTTLMPRVRIVSSFVNNMNMNKRSLGLVRPWALTSASASTTRLHSTTNTNTNSNSADTAATNANQNSPQASLALGDTTTTTIFGGDYAGHSATFSSVDGALIRVPDHYVPEAMVEWGQVPSCFECIVSEDIKAEKEEDKNDSNEDDSLILERNIVTIMPEVGCGLDNLDTMKSTVHTSLDAYDTCQKFQMTNHGNVEVATAFIPGNKRRVECIFVQHEQEQEYSEDDGDDDSTDSNDNPEKEKMNTIRTRISINLHENNQLKSPVEITKERKTSLQSSRGTIADGGGLDARTVSRLIGKDQFNKPFSDGDAFPLDLTLLTSIIDTDTPDDMNMDINNSKAFSLPGNIVVRYCPSTYLIETSLILPDDDAEESQSFRRIVVKRTLPDEDDGSQGFVECYEE